nr:TPM domain-containing protein [Bacteroidota bacterium]
MADISIFSESERLAIKDAIAQAEKGTSGEIRVFIDDHCNDVSPLDKAAFTFEQLEMHKTDLRNGVLIYLSVKDRKLAIIGDKGINELVPENFWESTKDIIIDSLKKGNITVGIVNGIEEAGRVLRKHFPFQNDDTNELPNDVLFGNE